MAEMESIQSVLGAQKLTSRYDYVLLSRKGIPVQILNNILRYTSLTNKEIATILPISERQLSRYKANHILRKDISSHLIQLLELFEKGYAVFGKEKFQLWIRSANQVLNNQTPLHLLDTSIGIQIVRDILGRIEHGVYS